MFAFQVCSNTLQTAYLQGVGYDCACEHLQVCIHETVSQAQCKTHTGTEEEEAEEEDYKLQPAIKSDCSLAEPQQPCLESFICVTLSYQTDRLSGGS